jgi:16S rRNA (guanine527-N7)-methyltransferase
MQTDRDTFHHDADVSRETLARLDAYGECLRTWTRRINLVSPRTLETLWARHIYDSAQLWPLRPRPCRQWLDLGPGAGLPGLVIAAFAADTAEGTEVTLVESDTRKAAFLASAARAMDVRVRVIARRIESVHLPPPDVISARALAPLDRLLALAAPFAGPNTVCLFPKGARAISELTEARAGWHIDCQEIASRTDPNATILRISSFEQRHAPSD